MVRRRRSETTCKMNFHTKTFSLINLIIAVVVVVVVDVSYVEASALFGQASTLSLTTAQSGEI